MYSNNNLSKFDFKNILSKIVGKDKAGVIGKKTTKVLHEKGGTILMAAGAVATVVPVVGWIAGPIISAGGAQLDKAQKAKLAAKLAAKKEPELLEAKKELESGVITDAEYESKVKDTLEESAQEVRTETIKKINAKDKAAAAKPNSNIMIGGAAVAALVLLTMRK